MQKREQEDIPINQIVHNIIVGPHWEDMRCSEVRSIVKMRSMSTEEFFERTLIVLFVHRRVRLLDRQLVRDPFFR